MAHGTFTSIDHSLPMAPYVIIITSTLGDSVLSTNATVARMLPEIATARQPNLLDRELTIGPGGDKTAYSRYNLACIISSGTSYCLKDSYNIKY